MATIPLQVTSPQINTPQDNLAGFLKNRDTASQINMRNAQTADMQAQADMRQKEVDDQNTFQGLMKDPATAAKIAGGDMTPLNGKVSPTYQLAQANKIQDLIKQIAANGDEAIAREQGAHKKIADALNGILNNTPDDATAAEQARSLIGNLTADGTLKNAGIDPSKIDTSNLTKDKIKNFLNIQGQGLSILDSANKLNADKKEQDLKTAQAAEANAKADKDNLDTQLKKQAINTFKADPTSGQEAIKTILANDPASVAGYVKDYQDAMSKGDLDAAHKAVAAATEHSASIAKELNPAIRQSRINDAVTKDVSVIKATEPIKAANQLAVARAMAGGDDPELQGVAPRNLPHVTAAAQTAGENYSKAIAASNEMNDMIKLMHSGNVEAYAYEPVTGVLTINTANGSKRVNMAEIERYAGPGSALQKIEGFLGKNISGKSMPDSVVNDVEQLHGTLLDNASKSYDNDLKVINTTYGSKLDSNKLKSVVSKPEGMRSLNNPSGGSSSTPTIKGLTVTFASGKSKTFESQSQLDNFKKDAGLP